MEDAIISPVRWFDFLLYQYLWVCGDCRKLWWMLRVFCFPVSGHHSDSFLTTVLHNVVCEWSSLFSQMFPAIHYRYCYEGQSELPKILDVKLNLLYFYMHCSLVIMIVQEQTRLLHSPPWGGSRVSQIRTRPSSDELANTLSFTGLTDKLYTASMWRNTFRVSRLWKQRSPRYLFKVLL